MPDSPLIHPTAVIDPTAIIASGVEIGPFSVIGAGAEIGENTKILSHVVIEPLTVIGSGCKISSGAVLGGAPQDLKYKDEPTRVVIGNNCHIRECVTVNRGTGEGTQTVVGDHCFLMAYSHLAHNCQVGNHVILANAVQVGGHVEIGDYAFIGGASAIHQNVRIGRMAFMGGTSAARQDLPPFSMNDERPCVVYGTNSVGLRRRGLTTEQRQNLKRAFFYLWFSGMNRSRAIETIENNLIMDEYLTELIEFVKTSKRGIHARPLAAGKGLEDYDNADLPTVESSSPEPAFS